MASNVINLKKLMRDNTDFFVSKRAIDELKGKIEAKIEYIMYDLTEIAKRDKRRTIMDRDVVDYFNLLKNDIDR